MNFQTELIDLEEDVIINSYGSTRTRKYRKKIK